MNRTLPVIGLFAFFMLPLAIASDSTSTSKGTTVSESGREFRVIALTHSRAELVSRQVMNLLGHGPKPDSGPLVAMENLDTNSVILSGSAWQISQALDLIKVLDVAATRNRSTQVLTLKHADPNALGGLVSRIIEQKWPGRGLDWRPSVSVDDRTRSLILTGDTQGIEELMPIVDKLDAAVE